MVKKCRHVKAGQPPKDCRCAWYGDIYLKGKRQWVNLGADEDRARLAFAKLGVQKAEEKLGVRAHVSANRATFAGLADEWTARMERDGVRPATIDAHKARLNRAKKFFGEVPLDQVRPEHLVIYSDRLKDQYSPNTAKNYYSTAVQVWKYAQDEGLVAQAPLPARPVRFPQPERRKALRMEDVEATIAALDEPYASLAEFCLLTGLRIGEALALTPRHVDGGFVVVEGSRRRSGKVGPTKTRRSTRRVALSARAQQLVAERIEKGDGRLWNISYDSARAALAKVGTGVTWHSFRHANVALRHAAGESLRVSQAALGHTNLERTLDYGWHDDDPANASALDQARRTSSTSP